MRTSNVLLYLVVLLLIFVPLYPKFPLIGVSGTFVSVRLEDFLIGFVFLVFGIFALLDRLSIFKSPIPKAINLYLGIGLASTFSGILLTKTSNINLGLLHAGRRVEYMLLFAVSYLALKSTDKLGLVIRTVLLVSLVVSIYGLGQQFLSWPVVSTNNSEFSKGLALTLGPGARINSTFAGHYDLAAYSVFPLLLVLGLLALPGKGKFILLVVGSLAYWILLLSASRITFASFFFCAFVMVWFMKKKLWIIPLTLLAVVSVFVSPQLKGRYLEFITTRFQAMAFVSVAKAQVVSKDVATVPDALKPPAQPEDRSLNIRLNVEWPRAIRAFKNNPVFGTGFSSVGLAVDNDFLRSLAETGLLGFAAFLLIFIRFTKTSLSFFIHYKNTLEHIFILAISCSLLSLLINAIFIDVFEASKIAIISWLLFGLAEKTKFLYRQNEK